VLLGIAAHGSLKSPFGQAVYQLNLFALLGCQTFEQVGRGLQSGGQSCQYANAGREAYSFEGHLLIDANQGHGHKKPGRIGHITHRRAGIENIVGTGIHGCVIAGQHTALNGRRHPTFGNDFLNQAVVGNVVQLRLRQVFFKQSRNRLN